jgi:hypothetical protein
MCDWYKNSTYLVLLSVPDEDALLDLLDSICPQTGAGLVYSYWCEPDMDNEHTAVAIAPSAEASRLLSNLPLTLRQKEMVGVT